MFIHAKNHNRSAVHATIQTYYCKVSQLKSNNSKSKPICRPVMVFYNILRHLLFTVRLHVSLTQEISKSNDFGDRLFVVFYLTQTTENDRCHVTSTSLYNTSNRPRLNALIVICRIHISATQLKNCRLCVCTNQNCSNCSNLKLISTSFTSFQDERIV